MRPLRSLWSGRGWVRIARRPQEEWKVLPTTSRPALLALALALAISVLNTPRASAADEVVSLTPAVSIVDHGEPASLTGTVTGGPGCIADRTVQLTWRRGDADVWTVVTVGTTDPGGGFGFRQVESYSGSYRAELPATGGCAAVVSEEAPVRVRALVDSGLVAGSLTAGSCVDLDITVVPPRPGQTVEVQRWSTTGWTRIAELALDEGSHARLRPCFGWEDVGLVRLRARWTAQDALNATGTGIVHRLQIGRAPWMIQIDRLVAGRAFSISLGEDGSYLYERADTAPRLPASNEKLLLAMALLDSVGADHRILTSASADRMRGDVVPGNLWILGRGDPEVGRARLARLADRLVDAGLRRVEGRVMGSTGHFLHDWWAPGWKSYFPADEVALPTALTFEGNTVGGVHIRDPEVRAAAQLTGLLEQRGVHVAGRPGAGASPGGLSDLATASSRPLPTILARLLRPSDNFYAETLGKLLAAETDGPPGTIAKGAARIEAWVADRGVSFSLYDCSGLSYANRVHARGIVELLWDAEAAPWGPVLRGALPTGGQGTLRDRLTGVRVRAKTGTLTDASALSGWVWLEREEVWAEFSILDAGMAKGVAAPIEDQIVRIIAANARA